MSDLAKTPEQPLPKHATILIIRHGEKPASGPGLAPAGRQRALAYVDYFQPMHVDYIFAAANSPESCRPQLTILPTAAALNLPIDDATPDSDPKALADQIRGASQYDGSTLLICWHHGHALDLASKLGVAPGKLPASAAWPSVWPGGPPPKPDVYGWMLIIGTNAHGHVDTAKTRCINENLMPDDAGQDPPNG